MMKEGNCIVNHEETNILFVEDDATICKSLPPILETYGYKVKNVNTYMQAIQTALVNKNWTQILNITSV